MKKYFTCIIAAVLMFQFSDGQNKFSLSLKLPSNLNPNKVLLSYDNGKEIITPKHKQKNNEISFTGIYYSKYAVITVMYPRSKSSYYINNFFVTGKNASLSFVNNKKDTLKNPLLNGKSVNIIEVEKNYEIKSLRAYVLKEFQDINIFFEKNESELFTNDSLANISNQLSITWANKELEFIKKNRSSYFLFWVFKNEVVTNLIDSDPGLLISAFDKFPKEINESFEGKEVEKLLKGRNFTKKGFNAPDFSSRDIFGNIIDSKKYRGKYLLLDFWASWCGPCLEGVPIINNIRKLYLTEKLEIIGITHDEDSTAFAKCIKLYNMKNWTHIYGDKDLINRYGNKPVPSTYLIDKNGIIIYSNWEDDKDKLDLLLKELLNNKE